jgi:N-formylglutamate amidohydrolase
MPAMDMSADPARTVTTCASTDAQIDVSPALEAPRDLPFVLIEPLHRTAPLVFASPHSGRRYPADLLAASRVGLVGLRRSEDAFVDELFADAVTHGAVMLSASVARAYVDLNRDPIELDPEMFEDFVPKVSAAATPRVQAGLGAIPRVTGDGQPIYRRRLSASEAERRIGAVHRPYHAMLAGLVADTKAQFGCAVLVDCHSMPSSARGMHSPDIVLGDRFGVSCHPSVTALAETCLRRQGYRVARNAPFAGGHTTQTYGRPNSHVHALQIEINRALYMDERAFERSHGFNRMRADMGRLAETLAAAALHRSLA